MFNIRQTHTERQQQGLKQKLHALKQKKQQEFDLHLPSRL